MVALGFVVGIVVYLVGTFYAIEKLEDIAELFNVDLNILIPTFIFGDVALAIYLLKYFFG
jgi:uncharacterized membrane protein YiaA